MRFISEFEIKVTKEDLLKALKENRAKHAEEFALASVQYLEECLDALKQRVSDIETGKLDRMDKFMHFSMPSPVQYLKEYDTIIGMLEMATDDTFEIKGSTYRAWVSDEWEWKKDFLFNTSGYAVKARR